MYKIVPIFIYILIHIGFIILESMQGIISFNLFYILLLTIIYLSSIKKNNKILIINSYMISAFIGILYMCINLYVYNAPFQHAYDDSYYFMQAKEISENNIRIWQPYETILSFIYSIIKLFTIPTLESLIVFNWFMSAFVIFFSKILAEEITSSKLKDFHMYILLIGNIFFIDSVVHLYRDVLLLFSFLLSMIFLVKKNIFRSLSMSFLTSSIRLANGGLNIIIILIFRFLKINIFYVTIIIIGIMYLINILDQTIYLGSYLRGLAHAEALNNQVTLTDIINLRLESMHEDNDGFTKKIYSIPLFGYILAPMVNIFSPIICYSPFVDMRVHLLNPDRIFYTSGFNLFNLLSWITIFIWFYVAPRLIIGLKRALFGKENERAFFIIFIILVITVSLISTQGRHRTIFIVLYPIFIALFNKYKLNKKEKYIYYIVTIVFSAGLLLLNLYLFQLKEL